jgi:ABC-type branched-subunit amino acid transport system ATPase component
MSELSSPLLEVRGLVKDYPGVRALGGVDLTVNSGQVHCLIGQNGAGKSTLIKCVSGLVEPTAGEVQFQGEPLPIGDPNGIKRCNGGLKIVASQPADFLPDKGLQVMETILQGQKKIDAVYTHDDDMAMGVVQAIKAANREDEMFVTGAGGSKDAMNLIAQGGLYRATFLYNPSMSGSAVSIAKLIAENKGLSELLEPEVPSRIELPATTVTKENVASVQNLGY